ncbi:MAG: Spy/CpxP family protein refolding chaperone [Acidobacteriota bacterium]
MRKLLMMMLATTMAVAMAAGTGFAQRGGGPPEGSGAPRAGQPGGDGGPGRVGRPGRPGPGARGGRFGRGGQLGGLDLSDNQRTQARGILLKSRDEAAPVVDQLQLARKELRREIFADNRDGGKIKDLSAKVDSLQKQVSEIRLKARTSIAGLLTPEQRMQMRATPRGAIGAGPRGRRAMPPPKAG